VAGANEYELRELWLYRSGKRSDIFFGRQYVPDLGGMKFDGLRVDYAKSSKLTLIGFGGLMPVRGSRSVTTDYMKLEDAQGNPAGRFVATGGFGGAYRTLASYGSLGAVTQVPLKGDEPGLVGFEVGPTGARLRGEKGKILVGINKRHGPVYMAARLRTQGEIRLWFDGKEVPVSWGTLEARVSFSDLERGVHEVEIAGKPGTTIYELFFEIGADVKP
jgi:hypothetical protein